MSKLKMEFSEFRCTLTPLTSLHIGNGKDIAPYEYVIKDNIYYKIDIYSLFEQLTEEEKVYFTKKIEQGIVEFRKYLKETYKESYGYIYKGVPKVKFQTNYMKKIEGTRNKNDENQLIISELIGSLQGKYIPGSSIKGAIRGAYLFYNGKGIFNYKLSRNLKTKTKPIIYSSINPKDSRREAKTKDEEYTSQILGIKKINPFNDPFKYLKVGDTENTSIMIGVSQVERLSPKNGILQGQAPSYIEIILGSISDNVEQSLKFTISMKNFSGEIKKMLLTALQNVRKSTLGDDLKLSNVTEDEFIEVLNTKFEAVLNDEIEYYNKFNEVKTLKILREVKKELEIAKSEGDTAILKIGKGSGFTGLTHILNNKNYDKDMLPISRLVTEDGAPLGWVKIKFEIK